MKIPIKCSIGGVFMPQAGAAQMMFNEFGVWPKLGITKTPIEQLVDMRKNQEALEGGKESP